MNIIKNGIFANNPVFVQLLGMCPTLATSTNVMNAVGMGLSATAVLIGSNAAISLIKNFIPEKIRIASYVVVIAGFVTLIQMLLKAYFPEIDAALGVFIPLIVVNCIILARAEMFASKNKVLPSMLDGLGMGIGFTCALIILGTIRELLGSGCILGFPVLVSGYTPVLILLMPPGAFLTLGIILGVINVVKARREA